MLLGPLPLQSDPTIGLAEVDTELGGELSTVVPDQTNYMNTGTYRKFLKSIAQLKRYGVTLKSVDLIARNMSTNYELRFAENGDIIIDFNEYIGYKNIWILTQLFYRIATEPQVLISSEEGE